MTSAVSFMGQWFFAQIFVQFGGPVVLALLVGLGLLAAFGGWTRHPVGVVALTVVTFAAALSVGGAALWLASLPGATGK